jgi:hypothetical protein
MVSRRTFVYLHMINKIQCAPFWAWAMDACPMHPAESCLPPIHMTDAEHLCACMWLGQVPCHSFSADTVSCHRVGERYGVHVPWCGHATHEVRFGHALHCWRGYVLICTYACTFMACSANVFFQCYIKLCVVSLLGVPAWYWSGFASSSCQFWMVWCVLHKRHASMLLSVVLTTTKGPSAWMLLHCPRDLT